jgi:uncharacterized protein (TIGR02270 family)
MATTIREFNIGLYLEHLEEASFLYEQRLSLFPDPEVSWRDIGDFEERLEAHLDALVVGEDLALEVCVQRAEEGDFGELFAAVCTYCRQERRDLLEKVLDVYDPEDAEKAIAVRDALRQELPAAWEDWFRKLIVSDDANQRILALSVLAYRRLSLDDVPEATWATVAASLSPDAARALGRTENEATLGPLAASWQGLDDPATRADAALALLRNGDANARQALGTDFEAVGWAVLPAALTGGPDAVPAILQQLPTEDPRVCTALGLLGDVAAVEPLIGCLESEELVEAAATALYAITGAALFEEVFVPEEIDEDTLFPEEIEKLKKGESIVPEGFPDPGENIVRLSQNPEEWRQWWGEHGARFKPATRYRLGKPYSPVSLVEALASVHSPHLLRTWTAEELRIRYGADFGLETDQLVVEQQKRIAKAEGWAAQQAGSFEEGGWYYAGRPIA